MTPVNEFSLPIRVYIEDTDAGGIVYYVNYLKYCERARTELLRALGYGKAAVIAEDLLLVVRKAEIDYLSAARLDDELVATASIGKLARSYVIFHQEVRRAGEVLCRVQVKIACVTTSGGTMQVTAMPADVQESLTAYLHQ
ncbi:MAG: YbgC/FadM family acyl-CoA thioesterase [Pseudomonadota bacterium]